MLISKKDAAIKATGNVLGPIAVFVFFIMVVVLIATVLKYLATMIGTFLAFVSFAVPVLLLAWFIEYKSIVNKSEKEY